MRTLTRHLHDAALVVAALALSIRAAFSPTGLGDYPNDAAPALKDLLDGDPSAFAHAHPAMGDLSLLLRAPFAELARLGHASELSVYRWGTLPCVLSIAVLALWLAWIARAHGTGWLGQWTIVLVALLNPLLTSAIDLGHPEELLTASLCVGALVAALQRRDLLSVLLLGLALACKQWSVVAILPVLFALQRGRVRALLGALATAAVVTIPVIAGAPMDYLRNQLFLAHGLERTSSIWSWWWPLAPNASKQVLVEGNSVAVSAHQLPTAVAHSVHGVLVAVDLLVAAVVARVRRLPLRRDDAFALMALVLLLRCTLDTETMPYYHAALLLDLLAWDALCGEVLPLRALVAAAVSYVLFDRLPPTLLGGGSSLLYAACTAIAAILLARTFAKRRSPRRGAIAARRVLSA